MNIENWMKGNESGGYTLTEAEIEGVYALYKLAQMATPIIENFGTAQEVKAMKMWQERSQSMPHPNALIGALADHPFEKWEREAKKKDI